MTAPLDVAIDIMRSVPGLRGGGSYDRGAVFSDDPAERFRFLLWRTWDDSMPPLVWWMLNPSTADEREDDATIRRCIGWAVRWCFGGILVVNAYALRSTDPATMLRAPDRVGPGNDDVLAHVCDYVMSVRTPEVLPRQRIMLAWGDSIERAREQAIASMLLDRQVPTHCLGRTRGGHPRHPVRLGYDTPVGEWP